MSKIYTSMLQLIGNTPLLKPERYNNAAGVAANLLVKLDAFNPAGSAKDRIAKAMIEDAEKKGILKKGSVIIEPTSGNTGIGLAAVAAAKGYRAIFTMPETMSIERRNLISAYGAEIVLTPGKTGMTGAVDKANELAKEIPDSFIPGQFTNPVNPEIHRLTTGPEIYEDTDGAVDIFLAGVGTGGTLSGVGQYLKEKKPSVQIIAIEPKDSPLLSEGHAGPHKLQGIGANFVPETLDTKIYDEVFTVTTEQAYETAQKFTESEGLLIGISGGAALYAASEVAKRPENAGKTIVAFLPDNGDRYLTTPGFIQQKKTDHPPTNTCKKRLSHEDSLFLSIKILYPPFFHKGDLLCTNTNMTIFIITITITIITTNIIMTVWPTTSTRMTTIIPTSTAASTTT